MNTTHFIRALAVTLLGAVALTAQAQTLAEIKVSYQPALYWALPFHIATEKGWWAEVGLKPVFSTFPAGVPQIAASASKSWDVGGTGSVPAVLGHVPPRFEYRCRAPLFDGACFDVRSAQEGAGVICRVSRHDGVTTAEGRTHAPET